MDFKRPQTRPVARIQSVVIDLCVDFAATGMQCEGQLTGGWTQSSLLARASVSIISIQLNTSGTLNPRQACTRLPPGPSTIRLFFGCPVCRVKLWTILSQSGACSFFSIQQPNTHTGQIRRALRDANFAINRRRSKWSNG